MSGVAEASFCIFLVSRKANRPNVFTYPSENDKFRNIISNFTLKIYS